MADKAILKKYRQMQEDIAEEGTRIRRYTMDPFVKIPDDPNLPDPGKQLRDEIDQAHGDWLALEDLWRTEAGTMQPGGLDTLERAYDKLVRQVDLIQRELISKTSYNAGLLTVFWMAAVLVILVIAYLVTHDTFGEGFEPWAESGPLKYGEVAFWSAFGALCVLLYKATAYLSRRDFDEWYKPWYVSTFIRAPFLAVILMMMLLEFAEAREEGSWIQEFLMAEGNKFYFIVFLSFCLGLSTDTTNGVIRDLTDGIAEFFSRLVNRFSSWLSSAVGKGES